MNRLERKIQSQHEAAFEILPWYVNGTLKGSELQRVERHLRSCVVCRGELTFQRELSEQLAASEDFPLSPERGLQELKERIEADEPSDSRGSIRRARWLDRLHGFVLSRWPAESGTRFAQAAAILILVGLVATGVVFRFDASDPEPVYRTLSDDAAPLADSRLHLHLVFVPDTPEIEMRALVASIGGEIVAGPSPLGVYTVATTLPEDGSVTLESLLEQLRDRDSVVFAEPTLPVGVGARPDGSADPAASLPIRP